MTIPDDPSAIRAAVAEHVCGFVWWRGGSPDNPLRYLDRPSLLGYTRADMSEPLARDYLRFIPDYLSDPAILIKIAEDLVGRLVDIYRVNTLERCEWGVGIREYPAPRSPGGVHAKGDDFCRVLCLALLENVGIKII